MTTLQISTVTNPTKITPNSAKVALLDGVQALLAGHAIIAFDYEDAANNMMVFKLDDSGNTVVGYDTSADGTVSYFAPYQIPLDIFSQRTCFVFNAALALSPVYPGDIVHYTNSVGVDDVALVTGVYHTDGQYFYTLTHETGYFSLKEGTN